MTVLIGFSFPDLTVLGADGRGIAVGDANDVVDNMQKIYKTAFGLMAGAGRQDIIEAVTTRFRNHAPASSEEATEIIREEVAHLGLADDDPALLKTCWLATVANNPGDGPQGHLGLVIRDRNYDFLEIAHNAFFIVPPAGMSPDVELNIRAAAQERFDQSILKVPAGERLQACVTFVRGFVRTVARHNDTVSETWSVGYHDATSNVTRVSVVGDDLNALNWH